MTSVLITGASRGIGRAAATTLTRRGHRVIATARDVSTLKGLDVDRHLSLDVTDASSVADAIAAAGRVDVLVSNAGIIAQGAVEAIPPEQIERLFRTNTSGSIRVAQAVLPQMRARGTGRLLFVSSVHGRVVSPGGAAYAASKWALEALVEALSTEVRHFGIQAALLQPGPVSSGALDNITTYSLPDDPYAPLLAQHGDRTSITKTVDDLATAITDAVEADTVPLRIPVGQWAKTTLAARRQAPDDVPFLTAPIQW